MQNSVLNYLRGTVNKCPDKTAFSDGERSLTFKQVYDQSRALGTFLHNRGIYKKPVVVFMNKSPQEIAAFLGIVTGGCFYVPIDEEMPGSRIELILDNVKSPVMVCDDETVLKAEVFKDRVGSIVTYNEMVGTAVDAPALEDIYHAAIDTDPIYLVFTSGSTGVPKGVAACHRSVIDYIEQLSEILDLGEDTVFGNQSPLYFDACLKEIYPTLKFGATAYLIPKKLFSTPIPLVEFLNEHRINTICWVVSALTMISAFGTFKEIKPQYLHTIAFGSEVFAIKQFKRWREALPDAKFTNLYGPTEGTGMCCFYRVDRDFEDGEVIPIGHSFPNREILLITDDGKAAADGEEGEICIRGTSVTLGYYNDAERTAKAFVQNPLNSAYPEIIYRTGDIGKKNERGELVFVSRKDDQIKHMGHRIELGEIEANASSIEGVKMPACIYDKDKQRILLYYVGDIGETGLLELLRERVPRYMWPDRVTRVESLPRTANGKIDRNTLRNNLKK